MTFFRVLWFVIKLAILVTVAVYLANQPGNLSLVWFGYRIDLHPIALSLLGVLVCLVLLYAVGRIVARIIAVPGDIGAMRGAAREAKGYQILTRGLAAAAAGDAREAKRLSLQARKLLAKRDGEPPITRLLAAQAAQLEGDDVAAHAHFKALAETPETAILGLRGLAHAAMKEGNETEARRLAERALAANPHAQWAAETALRLQAKAGRFDSADESLKALVRAGAIDAKIGQRRRAALLTEKARQALIPDGTDVSVDVAMSAAREAVKLAGDFAPARYVLVRLMLRQGKRKEAMRLVEQIWDDHPHEILGELYLTLGENEKPLERTQRLERLQKQNPDHVESHRILAEADIAAELWGEARRHVDRLAAIETEQLGGPARATCRALAVLEERERHDPVTAHHWLDAASAARPDAAWICRQCGHRGEAGPESGHWQLVCPQCQAIDSLEWRHGAAARLGGAALSLAAKPAGGAEPVDRTREITILTAGSDAGRKTEAGANSDAASVDAARLIN
ncbi:heme biosynthesis protein HemY [Dongia rigui]|uniref:Heme biosynthesis HemY N-terminal domain-containing protein n=1 Tax=Dongia rigui TaxID=940149 RepID=A0ABU5DUZ0_9PROT|nr:heme biosynthesis HemY N-terminal domain-containing protein [Dongia rigui]MDY0871116.1 heme biosynthesis HemY N-terminal domain-containing protein [Dongia rigui]